MKREAKEQKKVDDWNAKYEVGQKVIVTKDGGEQFETEDKYPAEMMCGTAVGWFKGISGAYQLDRAKAVEGDNENQQSREREVAGQ